MYTRRNLCFPTFHSTSAISSPSERATRSAASRIFSRFTRRLPGPCRYQVHSNRPNKKVGSRPLIRATRFRAKQEYIPPTRQKQDTGGPASPPRGSVCQRQGTTSELARNSGGLGAGDFSSRASLSLPLHQVVKRTCTSRPLNMPGTPKQTPWHPSRAFDRKTGGKRSACYYCGFGAGGVAGFGVVAAGFGAAAPAGAPPLIGYA